MLVVRTSKCRAYSVGQLIGTKQTVGFDHFSLAMYPFGLHSVEPRLCLGNRQLTILTPFFSPFFRARLLLPIHRLTSRLMCQLALSQINTNTFLLMAASFWQHHSKKRVVIPLTGRPSTKRNHASLSSAMYSP